MVLFDNNITISYNDIDTYPYLYADLHACLSKRTSISVCCTKIAQISEINHLALLQIKGTKVIEKL